MARNETIVSIGITLEGKRAQDALKALQTSVDLTSKKVEELKKKLDEGLFDADKGETEETIKKELSRQEKDLANYKRSYDSFLKVKKGVDDVLAKLSKSSYNELTRTRTLLQSSIKSLDPASEKYKKKIEELQQLNEEIAKRSRDVNKEMTVTRATEILSSPKDYSVSQIQEAVSTMTKLNALQKENTTEWSVLNKLIQEGSKYLEDFNERVKQAKMEDLQMKVYDQSISDKDLETVIRYWESMINGADKGSQEIQYYNTLLEESRKLLQERSADKASAVMADPSNYSVDEINAAIEATKKLQSAQKPGSDQWKKYGEEIQNAKDVLNQFNSEAKTDAMTAQLNRPSSLSTNALAEQKKYWQEMINAADAMNPKLDAYKTNLQTVVEEERTRAKLAAESTMSDFQSGNWKKTIGDTQEAIKQLKEYRNLLKDTDTAGLQRVDKVLDGLTQKMKQAELGYISYENALSQAQNLDNFEGTVEDLEKIRKILQESRNQKLEINTGESSAKIKEIDKALLNVSRKMADTKVSGKSMNEVLENLHTAKLADLETVAEQLTEEMRQVTRGTEDYIRVSSDLKRVNSAINSIKKDTQETENVIIRTGKRLASYVAVYATFNQATSMIRRLMDGNLALSDSMADIQKTTGMTSKEVAALGKSIDDIDTRTSQEQLYGLAAAAGQLGLKGQEDVLGFTKAANMITVALNELGAEGTTELMKIANLTGDLQKYGTEDALLRIGSAINELTANSAATAGPIGDFISRVGGIAAASNIATHEMAAIGATADATGQSMEVAGTTMNKVLTSLTSNTRSIAQAVNVNFKELDDLIKRGNTMDALIMVLDAMQKSGRVTSEAMKALGSDGARMNQFITSLVGNLDMLQSHLKISADAFNEMTSIVNEYNVKNESAMGLLQRIGNTLNEIASNPRVVTWITDMLNSFKSFVDWLVKSEGAVQALLVVLGSVIGLNLVKIVVSWTRSWREFVLIVKLSTKTFGSFVKQLGIVRARILFTSGAISKVSVALKGLFGIITRFPLVAVVAAVGSLVSALVDFNDEMDEAAESTARNTARMTAEFETEKKAVDDLFKSAKAANDGSKERSELISEINKKYGQYLGYMLNEKTTAEELASAQALVNAELRKRKDLMLNKQRREAVDEQYISQSTAPIDRITKQLKDAGLDPKQIGEAISLINTLVDGGSSYEQILEAVEKQTGKTFQTWREGADAIIDVWYDDLQPMRAENAKNIGGWDLFGAKENVRDLANNALALHDLVDARKVYNAEIEQLSAEQTASEINNNQAVLDSQKSILSKQFEQLLQMKGTEGKELQERESAYQRFYNQLNTYITQSTGKQKEELEQLMSTFKNSVKEIPELAYIVDYWGKGDNLENWTTFQETIANLDKASPTSLSDTLKAIEKESADISEKGIVGFNKMFGTNFTTDLDKFNTDVKKLASQIRNRLAELGRDVNAGFVWNTNKKDKKDSEREARKEMNAALAALEEHFLKRKTIIQQAYLDEKISGEEMNRQIADNDEEFRLARIELRKLLAGDANTFNQSLYPELDGKDLQRTSQMLQDLGDVVIDGLRKNVQKDEVEIREGAIKIRQAFEDELLKRDLFGKFENNFRESLDKLELLSSDFERNMAQYMKNTYGVSDGWAGLTEENQKKRLQALINLSEKSYQINEQGMIDELSKNKEFASWIQNLDANSKTLLLQSLRDYYDQRIIIQKQYTERLGKELEAWYEQSGQQKEYETTKTNIEKRASQNEILSGFGVEKNYGDEEKSITDEFVNEYNRLDSLREKAMEHRNTLVEGSQEYLATTALITQYEQEQNALLAQGQRDLTQVYMEEWQKRAERWGEWGEMFGDYLGEQVMLEKQANDARVRGDEEAAAEIEARQKKNKQELIKTALSKVVDLAAVWAKEFALKMMYNSLMEASDQQRTLSEVTNQGKQTTLSILLDALKGQAHEHGKGLPGLVTGAVIFAATMALQAMAKSAIANMFPEAAAETNKASTGRLATGMLTYAEGNYPVLGNDGQVYNAKYEGAGMKTGIYGGGAHFGIFSEKKPEAIIDGDTTQRLILNHPDIWQSIVTLSKTGRLDRGMRTFASGNIGEIPVATSATATANADAANAQNEMMEQLRALMTANMAVMNKLATEGVHSRIDMYGDGGLYKSMKKAESFANKRGYK